MYVCNNCGNESIKWSGQCSFCKEWNTLSEFKESKTKSGKTAGVKKELTTFADVETTHSQTKLVTSSNELNTLMNGGITVGSIILLSGEPGIGKSTLSLQLSNFISGKIVYVSAEENENQIFSRAKRLGVSGENLSLLCENNLENILETLKNTRSDVVILDSISVVVSDNATGTAGSISQVKEVAEKMVEFGKSTGTTIIII